MRQLVQLKQKTDEFRKLKTEVVIVFREEKKEAEGLRAIQKKRQTKFTFVSDLGAKNTKAFSNKRGQFATYVLDKQGLVREILDGTKARRPGVDKIIATLKKIEEATKDVPVK